MKLTVKHTPLFASVLGLALVGCTASEPVANEGEGQMATFTCPSGETLEVVFPAEVTGEVTVSLPDQEAVTLPRVESASGAKYSDGTMTFWEKGGEALVEMNGDIILQNCVVE